MVFIPLVGIDNHWKSVTFGGILFEKEDNDNYIWACESFKKVFVKNPKCIITDQDLTMKVALQTCFPLVKHRLCMWHIMKKFPSKVEYCLSTVCVQSCLIVCVSIIKSPRNSISVFLYAIFFVLNR